MSRASKLISIISEQGRLYGYDDFMYLSAIKSRIELRKTIKDINKELDPKSPKLVLLSPDKDIVKGGGDI